MIEKQSLTIPERVLVYPKNGGTPYFSTRHKKAFSGTGLTGARKMHVVPFNFFKGDAHQLLDSWIQYVSTVKDDQKHHLMVPIIGLQEMLYKQYKGFFAMLGDSVHGILTFKDDEGKLDVSIISPSPQDLVGGRVRTIQNILSEHAKKYAYEHGLEIPQSELPEEIEKSAVDYFNEWLIKQNTPQSRGLVPKKVQVKRGSKVSEALRWVRPAEPELEQDIHEKDQAHDYLKSLATGDMSHAQENAMRIASHLIPDKHMTYVKSLKYSDGIDVHEDLAGENHFGNITIYAGVDDPETLIHEVGHSVFDNLPKRLQNRIEEMWMVALTFGGFPNEYSKSNPDEMFCEFYAFALTDRENITARNPRFVKFLDDNVFSDNFKKQFDEQEEVKSHKDTKEVGEWDHTLPDAKEESEEIQKSDIKYSVKAFIKDFQGNILILDDAYSKFWDLPGGHLDDGETTIDGLARELQEEIGVKINKRHPIEIFTREMKLGKETKPVTFFIIHVSPRPEITISEEHNGYEWIQPSDMHKYNLGVFKDAIGAAEKISVAQYRGGIVALIPKEEDRDKFISEDEENSSNGGPHITVAHILWTGHETEEWLEDIEDALGDYPKPEFEVTFDGLEVFNDNSGEKDVVVRLASVPGLTSWRHYIRQAIEEKGYIVSQDYPFRPHLSLEYVDAGEGEARIKDFEPIEDKFQFDIALIAGEDQIVNLMSDPVGIEKASKRGFHEHDGFPEHPVRVKNHVEYFSKHPDGLTYSTHDMNVRYKTGEELQSKIRSIKQDGLVPRGIQDEDPIYKKRMTYRYDKMMKRDPAVYSHPFSFWFSGPFQRVKGRALKNMIFIKLDQNLIDQSEVYDMEDINKYEKHASSAHTLPREMLKEYKASARKIGDKHNFNIPEILTYNEISPDRLIFGSDIADELGIGDSDALDKKKIKEILEGKAIQKTDVPLSVFISHDQREAQLLDLLHNEDPEGFEKASKRGFHEHDGFPEHPVRVKDHQAYFTRNASAKTTSSSTPKDKDAKPKKTKKSDKIYHPSFTDEQREAFFQERGIRIPPAYTNIWINPDHNAKTAVTGETIRPDGKVKTQYLRSTEQAGISAAQKFNRIRDFNKAMPKISKVVKANSLKDPNAAVLYMIEKLGFRVGGETDTGAKVKAYAATTLQTEHVSVKGNRVKFAFPAKKGSFIKRDVVDPHLAKIIGLAMHGKEKGDQLFENATNQSVQKFLRQAAGKPFQTKDYRNWHAGRIAMDEMGSMPLPQDEEQMKKAQMAVATTVSEFLENSPGISFRDYIPPEVWSDWETAIQNA